MSRRAGTTLIEMVIFLVISIIFISVVFMGIDIVIRSLEYSKKVIMNMYHQNQIEISLEILNKEIRNAGSMVSVVRNFDKFKTEAADDILSRGILSEAENEFYVQYGVTFNFSLKDTESGTYVKIIKSPPKPPTISYGSGSFWQVITTEGFKESSSTTISLKEASLTSLSSDNKYSISADTETFVFFVHTPELLDKVLLINSKPYFGEQVAQSVFTYSESEKTLKMSKYLPFVDETVETLLLNNLESFEISYGIAETVSDITYHDYEYLNDNEHWNKLNTLKIKFRTLIPKTNETLTTKKIFWLPESDAEGES